MQHRAKAGLVLITLFATAIPAAVSAAAAPSEYPEVGAEAMAYYETRLDDWAEGPVEYLLLDSERDAWRDLSSDAERRAFIDWFWARRDDDPRDVRNPFKIAFYERVAQANDRFHGLPRGWRSDRGRVWILLGRPDGIRNRLGGRADAQVWTYYTTGRDRAFGTVGGEMTVLFARVLGGDYDIAGGFAGLGSYPRYLQEALEWTRQATIVDPYLELDES